jgi:hypothetical protein
MRREPLELPRKITLFRVVMERKLGIDFEHNRESISNQSLQTNEV